MCDWTGVVLSKREKNLRWDGPNNFVIEGAVVADVSAMVSLLRCEKEGGMLAPCGTPEPLYCSCPEKSELEELAARTGAWWKSRRCVSLFLVFFCAE